MPMSREESLELAVRFTDFVEEFKPKGRRQEYDIDLPNKPSLLLPVNYLGFAMLGGEAPELSLRIKAAEHVEPYTVVAYRAAPNHPVRVNIGFNWYPIEAAEGTLGPLDEKMGLIRQLRDEGVLRPVESETA